jgi:pilus assembly protein CpaC
MLTAAASTAAAPTVESEQAARAARIELAAKRIASRSAWQEVAKADASSQPAEH